MPTRLLLMSLLSFLFGCGKGPAKTKPYADVPHFPQTDNPAFRVAPFVPDPDFFPQAFILSPDKKSVFVLAYGMEGPPESMTYQLLRLGQDGQVQARALMPDCQVAEVPNFWWEDDGSLSLMLHTDVKNFDPATLKVLKTWTQVDFTNFMPRKKLDQLVYDEQVDAYRAAMQMAIAQSSVRYVRKVLNLEFLLLDFAHKPAEIWHLRDADDVEPFIHEYGERKAPLNPADSLTDGPARMTLLAHQVLDYKFAYPNLKYIEENVHELSIGQRQARFKLSNKEKHALQLGYADNGYLATADGAVWLLYERVLYRIEVGE